LGTEYGWSYKCTYSQAGPEAISAIRCVDVSVTTTSKIFNVHEKHYNRKVKIKFEAIRSSIAYMINPNVDELVNKRHRAEVVIQPMATRKYEASRRIVVATITCKGVWDVVESRVLMSSADYAQSQALILL